MNLYTVSFVLGTTKGPLQYAIPAHTPEHALALSTKYGSGGTILSTESLGINWR